MKGSVICALGVMLLLVSTAKAQMRASGTLRISGTVQGSLSLVINQDPNGADLAGSGTKSASMGFGTVSPFTGSGVAHGFTANFQTSRVTLTTVVDIYVTGTNLNSQNYNLTAIQRNSDACTYTVNGSLLNTSTGTQVGANVSYGTNFPTTISISVPIAATGQVVGNYIDFTATAN